MKSISYVNPCGFSVQICLEILEYQHKVNTLNHHRLILLLLDLQMYMHSIADVEEIHLCALLLCVMYVQFLYSLKSVPLLFHCFRNYLQSDRHTHRRTDVLEIILIRNLLMVNHTVVIASVTSLCNMMFYI